MKKLLFSLSLTLVSSYSVAAWSDVPVFSANGFVCGREGVTVTCKGPVPNGRDTITGTGHNLVYLTVNTSQEGVATRYTYFSDTGCLIGYTFNAAGKPDAAVAAHRKGAKRNFEFGDGKYDKIIDFCVSESPTGEATGVKSSTAPAAKTPPPAATAAKTQP